MPLQLTFDDKTDKYSIDSEASQATSGLMMPIAGLTSLLDSNRTLRPGMETWTTAALIGAIGFAWGGALSWKAAKSHSKAPPLVNWFVDD
jgi:dienelactone hydrolase